MGKRLLAVVCAACLLMLHAGCQNSGDDRIDSSVRDSGSAASGYSVELTLEGQPERVIYTPIASSTYPYTIGVDETRFAFGHSDDEDIDVIAYLPGDNDGGLSARISIFFQPAPTESEDDFMLQAAEMLRSIDYTVGQEESVQVGSGNDPGRRILADDGSVSQEFYCIPYGDESVIINLTYPSEGAEGVAERMRHMLTTLELR